MPTLSKKKVRLNFPIILFFMFLLFTVVLWDHYFNSEIPISRNVVSYLVLLAGFVFSCAISYFAWTLEAGTDYLEKEVSRRVEELKQKEGLLNFAENEVKLLRGIIPICSYCKNIRNDEGAWQQMETYIQQHSEAKFSHGICQSCRQNKAYQNKES